MPPYRTVNPSPRTYEVTILKNMIYAHEHLTIDLSGVKGDADCRMDDRALALAELKRLAAAGVAAVVDQTARGMGRNPLYAQALADAAGLRLVHATGYYKEPFLPPECYAMSCREMAALFVKELTQGMDDTGLRAGLIGEIGTGKGAITPIERQIFEAAAIAHAETGAPICTHTTLGTLGLGQLALFQGYGVDLSRVVLSHIDLSGDVDYMLRLLDTGVNIAFDTVGKNNYQPDEGRTDWLTTLCERGYAPQIVLSMDLTRISNVKELGYDYLLTRFVPALLDRGFRPEWLDAMLCSNPSRIYAV